MCCPIGGIIRVRLIKQGAGKVVESKRMRGGKGLHHPKDCGMNDDMPDTFCRSRFAFAAQMTKICAVLYDPSHCEALGDGFRVRTLEDIMKFEERFNALISRVMGEESNRALHVTKWAVLEYFRICTWNRAWCNSNTKLLWKNFDVRWTAEFDQLVRLQPDGRTRQGMAGAMRFLCYYCPSSSCGANFVQIAREDSVR